WVGGCCRGVQVPGLQKRPRAERRRVDRVRCPLCVLSGDGAERETRRRVQVLNRSADGLLTVPQTHAMRTLNHDGRVLFTTRAVRMFAYGALSVVLALYLAQVGLSGEQIGLLITATLVGDAVISLSIAGVADRLGRRRMLVLGAGLMVFAGAVFALTSNIVFLSLAAIIGTISP